MSLSKSVTWAFEILTNGKEIKPLENLQLLNEAMCYEIDWRYLLSEYKINVSVYVSLQIFHFLGLEEMHILVL